MQLHGRVVLPRGQAAEELFPLVVLDFRLLRVHDAAENRVCRLQHVRAGAKVFLQINAPLFFALRLVKPRRFLQKQRRLGLPEAIDALLHVADEE